MSPAHEPLRRDGPSEGEVHLGLVVKDELVIRQRPPQVAREGEPCRAVVVVLGPVGHEMTLGALGAIHRHIGALQKRVDVAAVRRVPGKPHAGVELDADPLRLDRRVKRGLELIAETLHGRGVDVGHEDGELVSPKPCHQVLGPKCRKQPGPQLLKNAIAMVVAQGVVDLLEPVQVDE